MPSVLEHIASKAYRRIFVDLDKVADVLAKTLPDDAYVLDVGGGDGDLLNRLLKLRPDVQVDMVDIALEVGRHVKDIYKERVHFFPARQLESHCARDERLYDAAMVSDVMHHIPTDERILFLIALRQSVKEGGLVLIKDVEPGHPIAWLGLYCDRYISGDKGTTLISMQALREMIGQVWPAHEAYERGLFDINRPNYLLCIERSTQ